MASGPLDGVRILEFTQIIAGPLAGMLLSDMGADVIKVEPIEGEAWRHSAEFVPNESKTYQSLNRGKRSLALDLARPECKDAIRRLVRDIDVVICNYRPDVPEQLGIDYDSLRELKPDLIYVDNTAFGRKGPMAHRPGYDIVVQSFAGVTASGARFDDRGTPVLPGGAVVDSHTGYAIAWAVCAALFHRERTGRGQFVETSLLANALMMQYGTFMSLPAADAQMRGAFLERLQQARAEGRSYREFVEESRDMQRRAVGGGIYYRCFNTGDGAVAVGCLSASLREKMRQALGVEDVFDRPDYDPTNPETVRFREELRDRVEAMFAAERTQHWVDLLADAGVPVSALEFIQELDAHPQVLANGYAVELEHDLTGPQTMPGPPIQMSDSPTRVQSASPPLGRDNDSLLASLGFSEAEIEAMRHSGAIR